MLISLHDLVKKYGVRFDGILHVGAHECEELNDYLRYVPMEKILWVEAMEGKVALCKQRIPGVQIEQAVASDCAEEVTFNIANNGQSSSMLEFGLHSTFHPHVHFVASVKAQTCRLEDVLAKYPALHFNFLNFDIQGAELKALKGMEAYLPKVDYVYAEVNSDYVYKDCALVGELDEFLGRFGLKRVETAWCENFRWGDAFYVRG
jgi:FkbM family methyltransferase